MKFCGPTHIEVSNSLSDVFMDSKPGGCYWWAEGGFLIDHTFPLFSFNPYLSFLNITWFEGLLGSVLGRYIKKDF